MPVTLNPYLHFGGTCREAITFYESVFGGDLTITTFGEAGAPAASPDQVMHAQLVTPNGLTLMASDTMDGEAPAFGGFQISLSGDDGESLRGYWGSLCDGAEIRMPLQTMPWGDEFGMLTDKHGVEWMVDIAPSAS